MKLLWLCSAGKFAVRYSKPAVLKVYPGTFYLLFVLAHLDMKVFIRESFVEDIDAVGWVLRDPASAYYSCFLFVLLFKNISLDDSWGHIVKNAIIPQINYLRTLHRQATKSHRFDPFRIYHPWQKSYVSFMDFNSTDTLADSVRTKYVAVAFYTMMFCSSCVQHV